MAVKYYARKSTEIGGQRVNPGEEIDVTGFRIGAVSELLREGVIFAAAPPAEVAAAAFVENAGGTAIVPADTSDSLVVGSDRMDVDPADAAKNFRAFFNKIKGAFRAGSASGTQWDDPQVGDHSSAFGSNTTASGPSSHAEGTNTVSSGNSSHAEGYNAKATTDAAHAEGYFTTAASWFTHAEGEQTEARAIAAHAEGSKTLASGTNSHAEGRSTTASGGDSHAEGYLTTAQGTAAHAEGVGTRAGERSHAEGSNSAADGYVAHAEGSATSASGSAAHSEGTFTSARGNSSHAEGTNSVASGTDSHAGGDYSLASRKAQFSRASGRFSVEGDAQLSHMIFRRQTADAIAVVLTADALAADPANTTGNVNVLNIPTSRAFQFKVRVAARRTDVAGEAAGWEFSGLIARDATGDPYFVGTLDSRAWGTVAAGAWDVTLSVDTTTVVGSPFLAITATGEAGKTIRWVAVLDVVEVG